MRIQIYGNYQYYTLIMRNNEQQLREKLLFSGIHQESDEDDKQDEESKSTQNQHALQQIHQKIDADRAGRYSQKSVEGENSTEDRGARKLEMQDLSVNKINNRTETGTKRQSRVEESDPLIGKPRLGELIQAQANDKSLSRKSSSSNKRQNIDNSDMQMRSASSFYSRDNLNEEERHDNFQQRKNSSFNQQQPIFTASNLNRVTSNFGGAVANASNIARPSFSNSQRLASMGFAMGSTPTPTNLGGTYGPPNNNRGATPMGGNASFTPAGGGAAAVGRSMDISMHRAIVGDKDQSIMNDGQKRAELKKRRANITNQIIVFNYYEIVTIFILILNAILYPNYISSGYLAYSFLLLSIAMTRNAQTIKSKFYLTFGVSLISLLIIIGKSIVVFMINSKQQIPTMTEDEILFYNNLGIYILKQKELVDNDTFAFDTVNLVASLFASLFVYRQQYNDVQRPAQGQDENASRLLHPYFLLAGDCKHAAIIVWISLFALAIETIFVQTLIQAFILILMTIKLAVWAFRLSDERQNTRYLILTFSQWLLLFQLLATFILQVPAVQAIVLPTNWAMICDMMGLELNKLPKYSITLHQVSICFAVSIIQLYKVVRSAMLKHLHLRGQPLIIGDDDPLIVPVHDNKSDKSGAIMKPIGKRSVSIAGVPLMALQKYERGKSVFAGPGKVLYSSRQTGVVEKFKDKTTAVKFRINEQLNQSDQPILHHAHKYYIHYSPQIWLWTCRATMFIWAYAYHDFQSWFILMWLMHSTLFKSTRHFIRITMNYYLPIFSMIFCFYYIINIPRVFEFSQYYTSDLQIELWRNYGFYQFSIPALEVALQFLALVPFYLLIHSRGQLEENSKEDTKRQFLEHLTSPTSPTFYYLIFVIITNLDLVAFVTIFFSGVNKIDFYHIFLMFFFVAYILWPKSFIRNYLILLLYVDFFVFEKYLYTLIIPYIPKDSWFIDVAHVLGLSTEYEDDAQTKYFRYPPKFQQWLLIIVVFLQYQVHQLLKNELVIQAARASASESFKKRYPRISHFWEILQHLNKEFLILFSFVVFFLIIIFTTKTVISWGFQIILCVFIISYIGVSNEDPQGAGIKRLSKVWFLIIWYSSLVLILQITYQFAALPYVRKALDIDLLLAWLPTWIRKNLAIIGFTRYTTYIWEKFLMYLIYFAVGVYVRKQMREWDKQEKEKLNIASAAVAKSNNALNPANMSINSDMQVNYFEEKREIDWQAEYVKIRFSTPYLVYKVKSVWVILDKLSQSLFVLISVMIMVLSNYWQISLSMAIHLTCFIGLCLVIASKLYHNRKAEKKKLNDKDETGKHYVRFMTIEECGNHWTQYKRTVNVLQVVLRQRVWLFQFLVTLGCMVIIYPTEFIWTVRETCLDQPEVVNVLDTLIFYLFWGGVYHSPWEVSGHGYFYNFYGYLIILVLLIFEKNGQQWALNRFGCTQERAAFFKQVEEGLKRNKAKAKKQNSKQKPVNEQVIEEDEKEQNSSSSQGEQPLPQFGLEELKEGNHYESKSNMSSMQSQRDSASREDSVLFEDNNNDPAGAMDEKKLKEELKKWIMKKYRIRFLNGVKVLLEDTIQFLLLISSVYKDSIIGLILLFGVLIFMLRRKIKQMQRLAWIVGFCMVLQYGLALSNLTSDNNPMEFPDPFNPYPKNPQDEGQFFIPWYRKIPLLRDNFGWAMYLGMGISNTKLNGLWIDYFIMGLIQAHLLYFGCQLFSIELKVQKGEYLQQIIERLCILTHGEASQETVKKESRKLKHQVTMYNVYKYAQMSCFMHFHQVTIIVTLLLAVLARSLFSFGYILVCMIMIYENHKFFRPNQENFRLQKVLKYWLQPYVFFDLTLQLVYQIPLEFLHRDQDLGIKWCWQNIIGFQDIWIKDTENVDEVVVRSIMFIVLKVFTYYFVTLQIQIFDSTAYRKYINKDFKKFIDMADTKGVAILWRANNLKIAQIRLHEQETLKMNDMLDNLKHILKKWQAQYYSSDIPDLNNPTATQGKQELMARQMTQNHNDLIDDLGAGNQRGGKLRTFSIGNADLNKKRLTNGNNFSSDNRSSSLRAIEQEADALFLGEDEEQLEQLKAKMGWFAKALLWAKSAVTEQIIFITSEPYLRRVALDMQAGRTIVYSKFERKVLSDIRDNRKLGKEGPLDFKDLKRTQDWLRPWKQVQQWLRLLIETGVTYSDYVCYLLMIISMMKNAGLISLVYPFVVFGYSLMEEINPKKKVWYAIMVYTEVLILVKFLYQLQFWEAIFWDTEIDHFQDILNALHIGLKRKASGAFGEMLWYFLPEILILFAIMSHIQKEIMIGLHYRKEEKVEDIKEALVRYLQFTKKKDDLLRRLQTKHTQSPERTGSSVQRLAEQDYYFDIDVFNVKLKRDVKNYEERFPIRRKSFSHFEHFKYISNFDKIEYADEDNSPYGQLRQMDADQQVRNKPKHVASMASPEELKKIYKELLEQAKLDQELNMNIVQKAHFSIQWLLYKNAYFQRLFPSIKEEKPGKDLYAILATFQFLICLFLIFFYTKMDADVTNISDSLTYNQFSGQMVIALFIQILVMIIDRYMYKSKTFISVQQKERQSMAERATQANLRQNKQSVQKVSNDDEEIERGQSFVDFLNIKRGGGGAPDEFDDTQSEEEQKRRKIEKQIQLESTKITLAIVSKFYLQWILLIFVHALVFWVFPIHGNEKLQNHAYCVKDADKLGIQCNEFGGNWALIMFYILYCCYFWVSALQIRYGVPEMKKGNFMMNSYSIVNKITFQGFYVIPFLFELKTFVDWTFTQTALDVFQWFILSATHAELFVARCVQGRYQRKPLGEKIPWYFKVGLGGCGQFGIVLLIAGPLLLFSNFNPISTANPVQNALIKFNILVEPEGSLAKNTINLFTNNYVTQLTQITPQQFNNMSFSEEPRTKSYDISLVQYIKMNNFADSNWAASLPNRQQLKKEFENFNSSTHLQIQLSYTFDRQNPNAATAQNQVVVDLKKPGMEPVFKGFSRTFSLDCDKDKNQNSTVYVPAFFTGVHYLNDKEDAVQDKNKHWFKGLRVFYSCENYWKVDQVLPTPNATFAVPEQNIPGSNLTGVAFYTFSSKIAPSYFKFSIITFYISIVLVIGKVFRGVCIIGGNRIFIWEIPNSEKLLLLCECVYIYRMRNQLDQEEQLYFTFADIMRSPEMIKAITGSSLKKKQE